MSFSVLHQHGVFLPVLLLPKCVALKCPCLTGVTWARLGPPIPELWKAQLAMLGDQACKKASLYVEWCCLKKYHPKGQKAIPTFASLSIKGSKDHQVSCVRHGPFVQIVFLHF